MSIQSNLKSFLNFKSSPSSSKQNICAVPKVSTSVNTPEYPDIDLLSVSELRDTSIKRDLLQGLWRNLEDFQFPTSANNRKFNSTWIKENPWLWYSVSCDGVFCVYCVLFGVKRSEAKEKSFISTPVRDWSNLSKYVSRHLSTSSKHHGCANAAEHFLSVLQNPGKDPEGLILSKNDAIVEKNRHILKRIIDVILLCSRQNIPLRGHTEDDSNFIAILRHTAQTDKILSSHLETADPRAKYTSPDVQNELIFLCSKQITDTIVRDVNNSPYFGFIADEATYASTMEQMAMVLRFFDKEKGIVREEFVGFSEVTRTTGEELANAFLENLRKLGVTLDKMRGQGYDGAANMSGVKKGVQARISELIPGAVYTHCKAHCLNLVLTHSCKLPVIRNMMDIVQQIAFAFHYSAKRINVFKEELNENDIAKALMEKRQKLQTLCETRWASRANSLFTFKASLEVIDDTLHRLANMSDMKARVYACSVERFDFILPLVVCEHVLQILAPLSEMLQSKSSDLIEATKETRAVYTVIQNERNDDTVWDALYESAVQLAATIGVEPSAPRCAGRQLHRTNTPADSIDVYWKRSVFNPFYDHVLQELDDRLLGCSDIFLAQHIIPSNLGHLTDNTVMQVYQTFSADIQCQAAAFQTEMKRWVARWSLEDPAHLPSSLQGTLRTVNPDLYPNIFSVLSVLIAMPVSTASAERSFSVMRRVKSYLRSTMTTERLSGLAMLHAHKDMEVDTDAVVRDFAQGKSRRLIFLFNQ